MKYKLIPALTTLTLFCGFTGSTAFAQDSEAAPAAEVEAPATPEVETPVETPDKPETSSDVASEKSDTKPDQGDAAGEDVTEIGSDLYAALKAGKWLLALGFALLVIVALARKFGGTWAKTKTGGYVLAYGIPILGAFGVSITTGTWSIDLFVGALVTGLSASALHKATKDVKKRAADNLPDARVVGGDV